MKLLDWGPDVCLCPQMMQYYDTLVYAWAAYILLTAHVINMDVQMGSQNNDHGGCW